MRIELHIERLVLDGLPVTAAEGPRVRAAVEAELARLLAAGGLGRDLAAGGALPRLSAPPIHLGRGERPDAIGRAVARSVHAGIEEPRTVMGSGHRGRP
ncbi:hypothetical protein KXR53_23480 [Inquilinus limosus]|uniref:hypothetical protein n=1 Tax=Inquilinus limosus TaxID=171674 RepID=UPI003F140F3C